MPPTAAAHGLKMSRSPAYQARASTPQTCTVLHQNGMLACHMRSQAWLHLQVACLRHQQMPPTAAAHGSRMSRSPAYQARASTPLTCTVLHQNITQACPRVAAWATTECCMRRLLTRLCHRCRTTLGQQAHQGLWQAPRVTAETQGLATLHLAAIGAAKQLVASHESCRLCPAMARAARARQCIICA